jgi:hypothetical protein
MITILKIKPVDKEKFKHVLNLSNELRITNGVNIISEGDNFFEIEFSKEQSLFILGRAFEPYKMDKINGSFTQSFDNSYLYKIKEG